MIEFNDPYTDPRTGTLYNKLGITDAEFLSHEESQIVFARTIQMMEGRVEGNYDLEHLKAFHRQLWAPIYDWAGEIRKGFDSTKVSPDGLPRTRFTLAENIEQEAKTLFDDLKSRTFLKGLSREDFVPQAAQLFSSINALHAFREGNGRTQTQFMRQLAEDAGHPFDLSVISAQRMNSASAAAMQIPPNLAPMEKIFNEATDPEKVRQLRSVIAFVDGAKTPAGVKRFDWNALRIETATPGQNYSGLLVGRDGMKKNFILRADDQSLIVGYCSDIPASLSSGEHLQFTALDHERTATELSEQQLDALLRSEYPGDINAQAIAFRQIAAEHRPVSIMDLRIELRYNENTGHIEAVHDRADLALLDTHLSQLLERDHRDFEQE